MIPSELYVPHAGWLTHEPSDEVARFLAEGWFEYREQAFLWMYLRSGDTFIDCGAHVGLFSLIAARAMENRGTIIALEPHPRTAALLEQNLAQNGVTIAKVQRAAVFSQSGSAAFNEGPPEKSAYSRVSLSQDGSTVKTITLDESWASSGLSVDFAKIDVEGVELEVLKGAAGSIRDGRLPLVMIECTEENLQRFGASTEHLFNMLRELNYEVCRFEDRLGELVPRGYEGPIGYDNLFAAQDLKSVNRRLAAASDEARRIADDVLVRGRASEELYRLGLEAKNAARARIAAEEAFRAGGESNWRSEQAELRAEAAEKRTEEAREQVRASETRADHARRHAEELAKSADEAFRAGGEANWRAEQAELRAEAAEKRIEEAREQVRASEARAEHARKHAEELAKSADEAFRASGEANWRAEQAQLRAEESRLRADALMRSAEEALRGLGEANSKIAQAEQRTHQAHEAVLTSESSAAQWRLRLEEMIASRYVRAGWRLGLTRKPSWIDKNDAVIPPKK